MPMTPLTPLDRTQPDFRPRVDTFFATDLPRFVTEANALQTDVQQKASAANGAASSAATAAGRAADSVTAAGEKVTQAAQQVTFATQQADRAAEAATAAGVAAAAAGAAGGFNFAGQAGKYPQVNPGATGFQLVDIPKAGVGRVATATALTLTAAHNSTLVDASATLTLSTAAAATLGAGWFAYLRNAGTGVVTIDPNGAETVDGAATLALYPGHVRLIQCDGTAFRTILISGEELFVAVDERPSGTDSGSGGTIGGQFVVRPLNTVRANTISGASLSNNVITLPAGAYTVYGSFPARQVSRHKARLFNISGSATLVHGTSEIAMNDYLASTRSVISGQFTLLAPTAIRVEHFSLLSNTVIGLGGATSAPDNAEVYGEISIRKVA